MPEHKCDFDFDGDPHGDVCTQCGRVAELEDYPGVVMPAKLVHCKREPYDVYIGRPSKWGNPFITGRDGTREEVIEKYRNWIMDCPDLLEDLHELRGKVLGCWCAPKSCHGDILVGLISKMR